MANTVSAQRGASERKGEALRLRLEGKTLAEIGAHFGVTRERARQMVVSAEKQQNNLAQEPEPLFQNLSRRAINALIRNGYNGDLSQLAAMGPLPLLRIKNLGMKNVWLIALTLEKLGVVTNAAEWMKICDFGLLRLSIIRDGEVCPLCGHKKD